MKKRILSVLLMGCMVAGLLPTVAKAAVSNPTADIGTSSLHFQELDGEAQYSTDNSIWISYTGSFTITGSSTSDTEAKNTVIVNSGTHNIILSDCAIGAATDTGSPVSAELSPFDIQGGTVNLTLIGSNQLYSANTLKAGLRVAPGASLFVTAASTGSLDARSHKNDSSWGRGAGIGGNCMEVNGTIFIQGGEISAYSYNGAGIGCGDNTSYSTENITVTGGTVFAQTDNGNGIGRGDTSSADVSVFITGGSVNALKGSAPSIGGTPQNGSGETVELYTLTLSGVSSPTAVTALTLPEGYAYGITSMKTDAGGKLYIYMPNGKTGAVSVTTSTGTYSGSIADNAATLLSPPTIGTLSVPTSFTAGHDIAESDLDSYKPTVTANGATITAQGWQFSVTSGGGSDSWSNWLSGGVLSPDTTLTYKLRYYVTYEVSGVSTTVTSNEVTLTIVGNATALALEASPASPQSAGTSVTLTATLTGFLTGPGLSGQSIIFKNGGTTLGTASLSSGGVASYTWTPGNAETYSLTAEYAATPYNAAATSTAVSYTVSTASIALDGVGYNVAAGTLTGTTTNMEYSLDGGIIWQDCAADSTTGLTFTEGAVKVRQKDDTTNERIVITVAAPAVSSALTLGSKTYNSVKLTAMTGYEYSRDGGTTWQDSNVFSSLSGSTAYSFVARIKATATTLPGTVSVALTVTTDNTPSGDGTGSGSSPASTGAPVIVDGKTVNIGTENESGDSTTVTVDQAKLGEHITGAAAGSSVVVAVTENGAATASLVVKNIEDMAVKGMTLTVQTGNVAYHLATDAIDTSALTAAFPGADMSKVPFAVTIQSSSTTVEGETPVLSPVAFTVTATYNGKTVSIDTFGAYMDRVIEVTGEQAARITTAVAVNTDGSVRHVPTNVMEQDGKYYAVINSRTNSTYALIENNVTFADAAGKWFEATVNEMGSRKIIAGRSASVFDGEAGITRAEFATILVRALGLPADGISSFSDVPAATWYTGAVATAAQYGLVAGKGENRYDPNEAITRQEAMLMLQRAAALTELTGVNGALDGFTDADSVGSWAEDAAKWSVGTGLIQGADGKLNPTADITRAESATMILRLLQKADLVDVRS